MSLGILAVAATFLALSLGLYTLLAFANDRQTIRDSLKQLEGYDVRNERDRELQVPLADRLAEPLLEIARAVSRRIWPPEYVAGVRKKLVLAGVYDVDAVDRFLAVRIAGLALAPALALLWLVLGLYRERMYLLVLALLVFALVLGPKAWLDRKTEERQSAVQRSLPDILDLLTISVEAGLGFEQALDRVVQSVPGPLSDEFSRMLGEVRAGSSRAEAMRALDERTDVAEVRSFVLAILQADTFGVSIGRILRSQSDEMRVKRRQLAQERAQKAPVKMLIPMVFCIFPALFVVVLGPAVLNIRDAF